MKNRIEKDIITAMKEKNVVARDILRVLKGEIERYVSYQNGGIELNDAVIVKMVKKLIENSSPEEAAVLEAYLPKQMTEADMIIEATIFIDNTGLDSPKDMGKIMSHFKENFDGAYDGKELSKIIKELFK